MNRMVWVLVGGVSAVALLLVSVYRHELLDHTVGSIVLGVLALPALFVLYMVVHGIGEGIITLLLWLAFKVVTFGLIGTFAEPRRGFPWYGLAREEGGGLVASEDAVAVVGLTAYAAVAVGCYFFFT
jgi:hypothetical protein